MSEVKWETQHKIKNTLSKAIDNNQNAKSQNDRYRCVNYLNFIVSPDAHVQNSCSQVFTFKNLNQLEPESTGWRLSGETNEDFGQLELRLQLPLRNNFGS